MQTSGGGLVGSETPDLAQRPQISSALLTWSVVILVPLTLVVVVAAGPIASLLNPANPNAHCVRADVVNATGHMLEVFAPQVVLYGLSVVLYGLLQAYRRFAGPAVLSARDGPAFDRTCAGSTRAVLLLSWLGTAVIAAMAVPVAHVLARQPDQVPELIEAFALFAPGIAGVAVITNLSRGMFAIGRLRVAAAALAGSWLLVIAADVVLGELAPARLVVAALGLGNTIGQTVVAIPMVIATRRICGRAALHGVGHATLAGLAAGTVSTAVGVTVCLAAPVSRKLMAAAIATVAVGCAVIAFGVVAYSLDHGDAKTILGVATAGRWAPELAPRG